MQSARRGDMAINPDFLERGFAVIGPIIASEEIDELRAEADRLLVDSPERGGARHGLQRSALFRALAESPGLVRHASDVLGKSARAVKLTVFDKTPSANWHVPWHQDLTITVREKKEVKGFGPWSVKGGLPHVQPPADVLEGIVALRLHLDDTGVDNGALRVMPGTHRLGKLSTEDVQQQRKEQEEISCPVAEGGAMLMSPLLLHASSPSKAPGRRRVLHFEYSATELPGGLEWG